MTSALAVSLEKESPALFFTLCISFSAFSINKERSVSYSKNPKPKVPSSLPIVGEILILSHSTTSPFSIRNLNAVVALIHFNRKYTEIKEKRNLHIFTLLIYACEINSRSNSPKRVIESREEFKMLFSIPIVQVNNSLHFLFALFFFYVYYFCCNYFNDKTYCCKYTKSILTEMFFVCFKSILLFPVLC